MTTQAYADLLIDALPRPIRSDSEGEAVRVRINRMLDRFGQLTEAEQDLLDVLGILLAEWEGSRFNPPVTSPLDRLNALLEDKGIRQKDLVGPVFPTKSVASEVLNGKRPLTYPVIQRLVERLNIPPAIFFD